MNDNSLNLSTEEREQMVQTIEMFEVIVGGNPHDCQSMEILKDAYLKLQRLPEAAATARKLAEAYLALGQLSSAMLEYEGILEQDRDNIEIMSALGEVEERMHAAGMARPNNALTVEQSSGFDLLPSEAVEEVVDGVIAAPANLMATQNTVGQSTEDRSAGEVNGLGTDGNENLAKFLIQNRLADESIITSSLERVQRANAARESTKSALSLISEVSKSGPDVEALLCGILDRSKFAYVPLEYYDIDRTIVRMLPESLTLGRLIVPFDLISRTIMIAVANPFDMRGKEAAQQLLDYHIQWHLASPAGIAKALGETYRLTGSKI